MNLIQILLSSVILAITLCQSHAAEAEFPPKEPWYQKSTASKEYEKSTQPAAFRHLTVGRGAGIVGHFGVGGNTWIKKGGKVRFLDSAVGNANTFLHNDNGDIQFVDHFFFKNVPIASCELISQYSSDDNWQIQSGLLIPANQPIFSFELTR